MGGRARLYDSTTSTCIFNLIRNKIFIWDF
jgi:hypothetical protein